MILVSSLFGALGFGGTAVAATAGTAAVGAASTGLSILQGIGSAFSALSAIGAGMTKSEELQGQAKYADFQARDEQIKGEQEAARLQKEMALTVQKQRVTFAAGGVSLSSVSVEEARKQTTTDAERELGMAENSALRAALARRRQAELLRDQAKAAMWGGVVSGIGSLFDTGTDLYNRSYA